MGKQKALNPEDLWDLPYSDEAATVSQVCALLVIGLCSEHTYVCIMVRHSRLCFLAAIRDFFCYICVIVL